MTGFGYNEFVYNNFRFIVNIKTVNSRFLDIKINLPQELIHTEPKIVDLVHNKINRGKVEFNLWIEELPQTKPHIKVNYPLLEEYIKILKHINVKYNMNSQVNITELLKINGMLKVTYQTQHIEYNRTIENGILKALNNLNKMRAKEGKILYKNFIFLLSEIRTNLKKIKKQLPIIMKKYEERIKKKVLDLIDAKKYDENRILMEVALFADKIDINEETERIESHIMQMKDYLRASQPSGRQMEFLLQEMLREINTVSSKIADVKVTKNVIKIKESIEKLKEQVRNIE